MIVIAIIGVLAAALFPSLTGYISRANDTRVRVKLLRIVWAFDAYVTNHDTWVISGAYGGGSGEIDYDPTLASAGNIIANTYAAGEPSAIAHLESGGYIQAGYIQQTNDITRSQFVIAWCDDKTFSIGSRVVNPNSTDTTEISFACNGIINNTGTNNTMVANAYHPMNTALTRGECIGGFHDGRNCRWIAIPNHAWASVWDPAPSGYCWLKAWPPPSVRPVYELWAFVWPIGWPTLSYGGCSYDCNGLMCF